MVTDRPTISVILPTRALPERSSGLCRAIDSIVSQEGVRAVPVIVVNGPDRDPALCRALEADPRCRVVVEERANLPGALRAGRARVDTPWFATLDDDDEYLPQALLTRYRALRDAPELDVVVTNGIRRSAAGDRLQVDRSDLVRRDPLRALVARHWLMPGAYLARADRCGLELFDGMPSYLENTYLALRLALSYRFTFLDAPTLVRHLDTPNSESKSAAYLTGQVEGIRTLLRLDLPPDVRDVFRRRVAQACHAASARLLGAGSRWDAWAWHLRSLGELGGLHYLPYTWRLLAPRRTRG